MDTSKMEHTAEDLIAYRLQRSDIFVAKPKNDLDGTDLMAYLEMKDGIKFCRIQCKGRAVINSKASIEISKDYVSPGFVVFLYVDNGVFEDQNLYCFFSSDIEQWNLNDKGEYTKNIAQSFKSKFKEYEFNESKIRLIKGVIAAAENTGDFQRLVYGSGNTTCQPATACGEAIVGG